MAGSSRRRFSKEFKLDAARLVTERGYSVSKAASELGISGWSLRGWIKDLQTSGELKVNDKTESVADELKRLRAENQRLRMEKEILKKPA